MTRNSLRTVWLLAMVPALLTLSSCGSHRLASPKGKAGYDVTRYEALFIEAKKQQILENPQKALELFEEILRLNTSDPVVHYEIGRIHLADGRNQKALEYSTKASELDPTNKWYHLLNADVLMQLGRFAEAAKEVGHAIQIDAKDPELYLQQASAYTYAGKHREAIRAYDRVESLYGINEDISFEKHRLYLMLKDADGAQKELERLVESSPAETRYYGALAEFHARMGNSSKALEYFTKVLEIDPGNPQVRVSMADYYRQQGDEKRAFQEIMTAFRSNRLDIDSKIRILLTYYSITETATRYKKEAYQLLDTLIVLSPEEAKAWSVYGDFLLRDKRNEEALKMFEKVIELDSSRYPVWEQLLVIQSGLGNTDALIRDGARATRLFPEQPLPYLFQSVGLLKMKRYEEAVKVLERGLFFVTDEKLRIQFQVNIAQSNYELGRKEKAYVQFEQILEADPNNVLVLNNYAYFLSLDGLKLDKALEMAALVNKLVPGNATYLDTYAWVQFRRKEFPEALRLIEKAMAAGGGSDATIVEHYGDILYHSERKSEALKYWKDALILSPDNERLQKKCSTGNYHE